MSKIRDELLQSLIEKMGNVMRSMRAQHCFPLGEYKLSRPQVMILLFISKKSAGVSTKDLAAFLNVTSGAITQFIDGLVEKGLVKREEDINDRRIFNLTLTKPAKEKFAAFKKNYYKSVNPAFNDLDEKEIRQFISLLDKISFDLPKT